MSRRSAETTPTTPADDLVGQASGGSRKADSGRGSERKPIDPGGGAARAPVTPGQRAGDSRPGVTRQDSPIQGPGEQPPIRAERQRGDPVAWPSEVPAHLPHRRVRLMRKMNRNVAMTATARKLVVIAWHVLTKGEPYRYALPAPTEAKYRRLRVRATGERRRPGPRPGEGTGPKLGPGTRSRTIKSLRQVYEAEGLPLLKVAPAGEARSAEESGVRDFASSLERPRSVPRRSRERSGKGNGSSPPGP